MKFKNFKSAIHNFTHSFASIDYTKSGRLAINTLIDLNILKRETKATFDFINKTILPTEAISNSSNELMKDYLKWLPEHFIRHDCDITKLQKLETTIWIDFDKMITPQGMKGCKELVIYAKTTWKALDRNEQIIEISQTEVVKENFIKSGIPEFS